MSNKRDRIPENLALLICVAAGGVFLAALAIITAFTEIPAFPAALVFLLVYCAAAAAVCLLMRSPAVFRMSEKERASIGSLMTDTLRGIEMPAAITTEDGKIVWSNTAMQRAAGSGETLAGLNFGSFCAVPVSALIAADPSEGVRAEIKDSPYIVRAYEMSTQDRKYYLLTLDDLSKIEAAEARADDELSVVAYLALDNLEELAQYARVSYREAANRVEEILKAWVVGMDGLMREYDRDKFLVVFPQKQLTSAISDKFGVLDAVRNVKTGEAGMSLTVSIGMSAAGESVAEREKEAAAALETALQRGGDQVVLRTRKGTEFFGGRTKSSRERTAVTSRVVSDRLATLIGESGNVLIMGHKNPDFDCIGACVGLARLASRYVSDVKIVVDRKSRNFTVCTEGLFADTSLDFDGLFIDAADGLDMIRSDTLLIVADVNNLQICESPEIAANVFRTVIVDHHRKAQEFVNEPELIYIEPSASSTCELVAEMLELSRAGQETPDGAGLSRREADIMLAGIMLDTLDFTRSTTARTFAAALYLRECGASSEIARTFFYEDLSSYITESKLGAEVCIYRSRIAIAVGRGSAADADPDDASAVAEARSVDRVTASKTADKLLTVRGVDAAFVLIETGGEVMISARSGGSINVQLVLEQMGGGGHFDAAGAQVRGTDIKDVLTRLKTCIDDYLS
ncbi:MAG: DHH family phosphoesterase [Clostridiales bacterium]|nr:DHH family phosphoesterase [Clostridiales bacterium]MDD7594469.1 DHH family phosphoesterase [Clostridiales bacterium]